MDKASLHQPFPLNITHSLLGIYHHRVHGEHREKIENEKSLSIFKKILCLVFPIPLSVRSVFSVVKILAGTADERVPLSTLFIILLYKN